ncbi:integrase family protein [Denitrovibrio acetiphilus DSM 12809]|uniref:Integrase family protein n=1 Tax=Denitrovibrio acetiphilus (strain DSM 12809 / NBRC 114555 / N2460) TaxID=522772 RepID=D4H4N4_DENA2|nr:tyrosine-type recombinase/integrase [Denitrovibrio acetiphilus]ADD67428.1 integrase family protein [Denitrovibrio acetiphilus DSM 12809]
MGTIHARGKKNRLYVYFQYLGVRRHEKTPFFCETGKNGCKCRQCKSTAGWLHELECKIDDKTFKYAEYFPESRVAKALPMADSSPQISFGTYAILWLDSQKTVFSHATFITYTSSINNLLATFENMSICDIKPAHIRTYIKNSEVSPKTLKNHVGVLSSILSAAVEDDLIPKNPCTSVKLPHISSVEVDPLSLEEITMILNWMKSHHPNMLAFFAVAFFTGMRTGEIMGLQWGDIDFNSHTITISRTITAGKLKHRTKTADSRTVDILTELDEYLSYHKQFTYMKSEWLFLTYENKPFNKTDNIIKTYWKPCLKALGIKYRTLYQTRHTFACLMLDVGENINWLKKMLGHKTLDMILRRYGNRIDKTVGRKGGKLFIKKKTQKNQLIRSN